jgi:hypothetical protein
MVQAMERLRAAATKAKAPDPGEGHVRDLKEGRCRSNVVFLSAGFITLFEL